jgi:Flp pilus assembly protein TadG
LSLIQRRMDNIKEKKGQALVEIALALPILLLLLCGIVDFGRILYSGIAINMAAQEAARYASFGHSDIEISDKAKDSCSLSDENTSMRIRVSPSAASRTSGTYVKVEIDYDVKYITPLMNKILGGSFTVKTSSTIRVE